ncbi:MAG: FUSC family protein, partial [Klebsiella sp.]
MHWLVRLRLAWRQITTGFPSRARLAARDALATALACLLAWLLAVWLLGHEHPTFAIVSAVVCLAPGVPSHLKQARNLVIGCTFGIVMGELMWQLPDTHPLVRMSIGMFFAILLGVKWFTEFGHLNRGDMLTSEQHRCHNEKKKFQRR